MSKQLSHLYQPICNSIIICATAQMHVGRRVLNPKAVVKANVPTLTSVKQESATKLTATLATAVEKVDLADVALVRDESHSVIAVKDVTIDSADATKLNIETYVSMTDGASYTLTYTAQDEAKTVSTATFTATDGKIASFALSTATIPANKATTIKYSALDANGIVIYEKPIDDKGDGIDIDVTSDNGYLDGAKLTLLAVGNTATVTVAYHTYNYDAQGNETGRIENKFTVTAVDNSVAVSGVKYTLVGDADTIPAWENLTVNTRLAMNDAKYARFQIKDSSGDDITATCEYTVESSNNNIVIASGVANGAVSLTPVKEGSAYLVLKDKDKTINTLAITVVKARELATFTLDTTSVAIATKAAIGTVGSVSIPFSAKDQYGEGINVDVLTNLTKGPAGTNENSIEWMRNYNSENDHTGGKIIFGTPGQSESPDGTYTFSTVATDASGVSRTRTITVNVRKPSGSSRYELQFVKGKGENGADATKTLDTTVTKDTTGATEISVNIVKKSGNGVIIGKADDVTVQSITVKGNDGKTYGDASFNSSTKPVSSAAVTVSAIQKFFADRTLPDITVVSKDDADVYTKNLPAGSYTVAIKALQTETGKSVTITPGTFKVEDKQPALTASVLKTGTDDTSIKSVLGNKDYVKYVYNGITQESDGVSTVTITKVYGKANGKIGVVSKATVAVQVGNKKVNIDVPINRVFTSTGEWDATEFSK